MIVKICGLCNLESAGAAVRAGADLLGFVFAPSRRRVTVEVAREVVRALPRGVATVGVFVNEEPRTISEIVEAVGLTHVQLSGDETPDILAHLSVPALRAVRLNGESAAAEMSSFQKRVELFVLDTYRPGRYGGTGEVGDWSLAAAIAAEYPCLLAGGLTPENVGEGIARVKPLGVDVSGGVEVDGAKYPERIFDFVRAAKAAHQEEQKCGR